MLCFAGRLVTVVALCLAVGLQWLALQSVAWTSMLVQNARQLPFCAAVKHTFDGAHPCSLCHVVQKGKASQHQSGAQTPTTKIDIITLAREVRLVPSTVPVDYNLVSSAFWQISHSPPAPPPRSLLS